MTYLIKSSFCENISETESMSLFLYNNWFKLCFLDEEKNTENQFVLFL